MSEPSSPPPTFEQALAELERIVRELEDGAIGLEDALSRYEQGGYHELTCAKLREMGFQEHGPENVRAGSWMGSRSR